MTAFVIRRLLQGVVVVWAAATIVFCLVRLAPGDPFSHEKAITEEVRQALNRKYGLDRPLWDQYLLTLSNLARGDLGPSFKYKNWSAADLIRTSFPVSAALGLIGLTLAVGLGVLLGAVAAARKNSVMDHTAMGLAVLGICLPNFVVGPLLVLFFAFELRWLPPGGWGSLIHLVLPAATIALPYIAYISRLTRAGMLENLNKDYVRTARAKGLAERSVVFGHALKNSIIPVVAFLGPAAAGILTGSLVVEKVFNIPGLGQQFVNAAQNRDYSVLLGDSVLYVTLLVVLNLASDIAHALLDPRVRLE